MLKEENEVEQQGIEESSGNQSIEEVRLDPDDPAEQISLERTGRRR